MTRFVKTANSNEREHRRELAESLNQALLGRLNNNSTVTLAGGTTTTTITNPNFGLNTVVLLVPLDATGQGVTWHMSDVSNGAIEITHDDPVSDAVFAYLSFGS